MKEYHFMLIGLSQLLKVRDKVACFTTSTALFKITQIILQAKNEKYLQPKTSLHKLFILIANQHFAEFLGQCLECPSEFANIPEQLSD